MIGNDSFSLGENDEIRMGFDGGIADEWLREGGLHPLISARYPLTRAPEALDALLGRQAIGKLVILPQQHD